MWMRIQCITCLVSILTFFSASEAFAWKASLVAVSQVSQQSNSFGSTNQSSDGYLTFGGGLLYEIPMGGKFGLEVGALYLSRKIGGGTDDSTLDMTGIRIPMMAKYSLGNFTFGFGPSFLFSLGDITRKTNSGTSEIDYQTAGYNSLQFGLEGGLGLVLDLVSLFDVVVEARYHFTIVDPSTRSGVETSFTDLQVFLGIQFGGGGGDFDFDF